MLSVRKPIHVVVGTIIAVAVAAVLTLLHVEINYPPDIRGLIRPKAVLATTFVTAVVSAAVLVQNRRTVLLTDELQKLVNRDRLTDVATRDFFFARMSKMPEAFGISLMIDIDEFKSVNDTYGHLAGDAVIARVATILSRNLRDNDLVCRFGGEEFIVFLYEQSEEGGFAVAERMRQMIEEDAFEFNGTLLRVTVSIGGSLKDRIKDIEMAIQEADHALYRAKNAGRNRTIFADALAGTDAGKDIDLWVR